MTDDPSTWRSATRGAIALFAIGMAGVIALALHSKLSPGNSDRNRLQTIKIGLFD